MAHSPETPALSVAYGFFPFFTASSVTNAAVASSCSPGFIDAMEHAVTECSLACTAIWGISCLQAQ